MGREEGIETMEVMELASPLLHDEVERDNASFRVYKGTVSA